MAIEPKTALTPQERVKAAYLSLVRGLDHQEIAVAYEVNMGRVSDAVRAIEFAAQNPKAVLALFKERSDLPRPRPVAEEAKLFADLLDVQA